MITNQNDILNLKNQNKIYIPEEEINTNYTYKIKDNIIQIITNNCNGNICQCKYYYENQNIITMSTECDKTNEEWKEITKTIITSDVNNSNTLRIRWIEEKGIILLVIILGVIIAKWLTKERKHV